MSQQYLRLNKKKELEAELKQAKYTLVKEKARCFKVLNDSEPFIPKCGKDAQKVLEEFNNLCDYYGIDPNSFQIEASLQKTENEPSPKNSPTKKTPKKASDKTPSKSVPKPTPNNKEDDINHFSQAFHSRMQVLNKEENEKKALLDKLNKSLQLLQKQNDDLANKKNVKVVTLENSFANLKNQINGLHEYFTNFNEEIKSKIKLSKELVRKVINKKKNKGQGLMDKFDAKISELQNQKKSIQDKHDEKISKLSFQQIKDQDFNYVYTNEKVRGIISQAANEVQKRFEERLKSSRVNKIMDNISKKIVQLNNKISLVDSKINNYREKRAQRLSSTMVHNWSAITSSISKVGPYNIALDEYIIELQEEDAELTKQLNAELEIVNAKVPGTNLTILELRKEITELTAKLSDLTISKTEQLQSIHRQHDELEKASTKLIEDLEKKL